MTDVATRSRQVTTRSRRQRVSWRYSNHVEILLISFSALLIEIAYTRIISYKLFYYYVYLVIGLALLGVGAGGVAVAVSKRLRAAQTDTVLFWSFLIGALATIGTYVVVAMIRLNTLSVWLYGTAGSVKSLLMLLVLCLCLFICFVPAGIISATLFSRRPEGIGGLYFSDLLGAGIACAVVIYVISSLGAPATVMLAVAVMATGAFVVATRQARRPLAAVAAVLVAVGVFLTIGPGHLPDQRLDASKTAIPPGSLITSNWGPVFRVDIGDAPGHPDFANLYHDGILGASIERWDGTRGFLSRYDFPQDSRSLVFRVLGAPPSQEAIIGAAGGHEVLTSLYYGAQHVDAVELNPVTVHYVTTTFANFDGHLAQNPHVSYINADGRSFMARTPKQFGLVYYPAPDSYAASNGALSSAYVLSESYLYSVNGIQSMLEHLTPNGVFVAQFGEVDDVYDLRTARFTATVRQALSNLGITDPKNHILVASTTHAFLGIPLSTILVQKSAFTPAETQRFLGGVKTIGNTFVLSANGHAPKTNPVNDVVATSNANLGSFYSSYPYNITPTTDNDPFFYHFARFGTVISNFFHPLSSADRENAVGERVLLLLLAISVVAATIFLLLPFVAVRKQWRQLPRKGFSAIFFAGVGFGFIFFEITLMQLLNLFLGFPTYSLTITLMSLLVFTGLGALASQRIRGARARRRAIPLLLVVLCALCLFYLVGLTPMTNALLSLPLAARILITFAVLAPLGLCFGMFMPIGLGEISQLSEFPQQYVAWGWAVNGFASVVGSALATILAMSFGFDFVLGLGLVCYVIAVSAWSALSRHLPAPGS